MTHGYHQSIMDFTVPKEQGSSLLPAEQRRQLVERWRNSADMAKTAWPLHKRLKSVTPIHDV